MTEREIEVTTPDGTMTTLAVHPEGGGPYPVAVLYMDGVGYREQIKKNARRFAEAGYYVVAPDLYYRHGKGVTFDPVNLTTGGLPDPDRARLMELVATVTPPSVARDTRLVFDAVASDPAARLDAPKVCVGYCMGARLALHSMSALAGDFAAGAGFHPGELVSDRQDSPHHDLDGVRGELLFGFAGEDRFDTGAVVDRMRREMAERGVKGTAERVPGTLHGYTMADLPVYNREASEEHFEKTLELWRRAVA